MLRTPLATVLVALIATPSLVQALPGGLEQATEGARLLDRLFRGESVESLLDHVRSVTGIAGTPAGAEAAIATEPTPPAATGTPDPTGASVANRLLQLYTQVPESYRRTMELGLVHLWTRLNPTQRTWVANQLLDTWDEASPEQKSWVRSSSSSIWQAATPETKRAAGGVMLGVWNAASPEKKKVIEGELGQHAVALLPEAGKTAMDMASRLLGEENASTAAQTGKDVAAQAGALLSRGREALGGLW